MGLAFQNEVHILTWKQNKVVYKRNLILAILLLFIAAFFSYTNGSEISSVILKPS